MGFKKKKKKHTTKWGKKKKEVYSIWIKHHDIYKAGMLFCLLKLGKGSRVRALSATGSLEITTGSDFT